MTCTDFGRNGGGLFHGGIGEMVWRVSNRSLNGLGQHAKYLLTARNLVSKHYGKPSGSGCVRQGDSDAAGVCCPPSSRVGARL